MLRTSLAAWQNLQKLEKDTAFSLTQAFAQDPQRAAHFSHEACGIFYDYSKQHLNQAIFDELIALANACELTPAIHALFSTAAVNSTEHRQALHWLLRAEENDLHCSTLKDYWTESDQIKERMSALASNIFHGKMRGYTGKPFTDVVNIGIGGSDLGPAMVYQALSEYHLDGIRCHYVANMCAHDLLSTLKNLDPHSTLFIIASKSFTTLETMTNANSAKAWLLEHLLDSEAVADHFVAVSSKPDLANAWGIRTENVFSFGDWVGGRYSLWSAIGLSLCIGLGAEVFNRLLVGAREMDTHFLHADFKENLPVLMALIGVWNTSFNQWPQLAVIPYDHRLRRFPAFLQQLEMESNGKHCTHENQLIDYPTCPTVWGEAGSNSQHSFFQLFHQGNFVVPIDFIAIIQSGHGKQEHQDWLFTNCLAQSRALMIGQGQDNTLPNYQHMQGNKPSSTLVLAEISPETLGSLIALYEHKVYVQSVIWNINPFDQWGVELGKKLSTSLHQALTEENHDAFDASTLQLLARYKAEN